MHFQLRKYGTRKTCKNYGQTLCHIVKLNEKKLLFKHVSKSV